MFGAVFLLPLFLQQLRGLGAYESGLLLLPQGLAAGIAMPIGGKLFDKVGIRPLMLVGLPLLAIASFAFTRLDVTTPDQFIVLVLIIRGLCMGILFMPLNTAIMNQVPFDKISRGSSLTNAVRQLFASFGIAIVATILSSRQTFHTANLAERVTATSPMAQRMFGAASSMAAQHGWTAVQAKQLLLSILDGQIQLQAAVMSFQDSFLVLGIMALAALIPALFLRTSTHAGAGAGVAMPMEM
jgi:MFS family permease